MNPIETAKKIPPVVWLVGGAAVVGFIILKGGSGSSPTSSGAGVSDAGGGGGGGSAGPDTLDSLSQGFVDLVQEVRAQEAADAEWKQGIEAAIAAGAPTNPNPAPAPAPSAAKIPYIKKVWGADVAAPIKRKYSLTSIDQVFAKLHMNYGAGVNNADLKAALRKEKINYGSTVDVNDLAKLFARTGVKPAAPTAAKP